MKIARVGLLQLVALVLLVGGVLSETPLFAQDKATIGKQPLQEGQRVIRGTISTDATNVRIKVNNQELGGGWRSPSVAFGAPSESKPTVWLSLSIP